MYMNDTLTWLCMRQKSLKTIACYIVSMVTTIQISEDLLAQLKARKMSNKESYENVIWDLWEDSMEL